MTEKRKRAPRLKTMDDVRIEMAKVYRDARAKTLEPTNASKLVYILAQVGAVIESSAFEDRIKALEAKMTS